MHTAARSFVDRHLGPRPHEFKEMLRVLGLESLDQLVDQTVPASIRLQKPLKLREPLSEEAALDELKQLAKQNKRLRSFIGMGYSPTITPGVIRRNILENPGWYTQYTPYQAEIAQGRLEALLNFQTLVVDLTGLPIANASLLDEATACAEAMALAWAVKKPEAQKVIWVSDQCHPQNIGVVCTRAQALGIEVRVGKLNQIDWSVRPFAVLVQYPQTDGSIADVKDFAQSAHQNGAWVIAATDPLALTLLEAPGTWGADIAVGSMQRFGVPMGFGGPHAAFLATRDEFKRQMPGRIVGLSQDAEGRPAIRLALQTREQHIRRDKATSNICTAQVLLAVMASMYAVYHGPEGLRAIALQVAQMTEMLRQKLKVLSVQVQETPAFDTLTLKFAHRAQAKAVLDAVAKLGMNLRDCGDDRLGIALDEATTLEELRALVDAVAQGLGRQGLGAKFEWSELAQTQWKAPAGYERTTAYLTHPVFHQYRSETEMLRYISRLQAKDLSLTHSMIALGSCTMKLNATAEMTPITWPEFADMHPFAPADQTVGYRKLFEELERDLAEITGFDAVSLQPNAGSQGEYAGLLAIRGYHQENTQAGAPPRDVCLIPKSAHGTNPASAVMAGFSVVVVDTDSQGNIDLTDLDRKIEEYASRLGALMITYPSTHGVFETSVSKVCEKIHAAGGLVYMDGANMNAQVGLCRPGDFGPDVCHLNLHKTFCIPHGGGGPGMGPIAVKKALAPYLPNHPVVKMGGERGPGAVSAAPWGSASILPISWMYIRMMGESGLKLATQVAILNANYLAKRMESAYPVLYQGESGRVAHECIFDTRAFKERAGVEVEDIAKRLMDYGFHAPTVSFPVAGTLMVEPTESESKQELDRFVDAMLAIREEIAEIEAGRADRTQNVLKGAPHTAALVTADRWERPYSRATAAFPRPWIAERKFWPSVARINNVLGDRNLVCACPPVESYV